MRERIKDRGRLEHILNSILETIESDIPELKPYIEKFLQECE